MKIFPSHVALLVSSVRKAADYLSRFEFEIGPEEIWDGEGTKEIYVEKDQANSLLLMEPVRAGAYQRAMEKRGPGLHHLAIDVADLDAYLSSLVGSGWLLHPISAQTMKKKRTAYLARPGFPALIEVQQRDALVHRPLFVTSISLPHSSDRISLVERIGLGDIVRFSQGDVTVSLAGKSVELRELIK